MTFDLASARGWVAQNQVFAARKQREGDMTAAQYFTDVAATEQAKVDAVIEAKFLARELAEYDSPLADGAAKLWYLLDEVIPETDLPEIVEADVVDEKAPRPRRRRRRNPA